ncbi:hypothetical protein BOTBODRAFT_36590 [Botryobasidium botryosum FD-172 SS1]|uniref:Carbohydrate kinase PfkB domain-containing protein n=1 Tax=Botryobasidium botryosum (strain FD-172 SS1) TaxID=930990 RepID=A0A067MEG2_BOTB1|nr:hypothetical protein BOTBODRAFT_36590 [Botryobasidium botryosum FD-172 SS1]
MALNDSPTKHLVTLGMFIIDTFEFRNDDGELSGKTIAEQIGGGGTYCAIGARVWLPPDRVGMIVDRGHDFPIATQEALDKYGSEIWHFRDDSDRVTTKAVNIYRGDYRGFQYLTPRIRITPVDLEGTPLARPTQLHFICSPKRAAVILQEVREISEWTPITIYEPIPFRCVPEELPALRAILSEIVILSPNAEEAHSLLSLPGPPTKSSVEHAAQMFLDMGVGKNGSGSVIIRSGAMGAYVLSRDRPSGMWIDAYWREAETENVRDVTGAGNSFLGGLSAGLHFAKGDVYEASLYASVSASYTVEQNGLPRVDRGSTNREIWNGDRPEDRLKILRDRHALRHPA